jgi:predicted PurR-regulated permease PerM
VLWWISGGIVVLALIVLVVVAVSVVSRLRTFDHAARAMQARIEDGQRRVEPRLAALQQTVEQVLPQLEAMAAKQQERAALKAAQVENS